jgi:nucleoside-diphosphate-sugar epimerase
MTKPRIVITGASGFVGAHLIDRCVQAGYEVIGIVRPGTRARPVGRRVQIIDRDLERVGSLTDVLRAGDAVVHLAGRAHVVHERASDPLAVFRAANVAPTTTICRSAVEAGATRVVFISSAKVYGEGRDAPYTLADALAPHDAYARSKVEAEEIVRSVGGTAVGWAVLRPPFVYGPGGKGNFPRLVALARLAMHVPLPLAGISNQRSIVYVGNLVDAILHAALDPRARNRILLPTDPHDVSTPDLIRAIADTLRGRARLFPFPPALLRAGAAMVGRSAEMDRLTESLRLDSRYLRDEIGWTPRYSLAEALAQSLFTGAIQPTPQ